MKIKKNLIDNSQHIVMKFVAFTISDCVFVSIYINGKWETTICCSLQ